MCLDLVVQKYPKIQKYKPKGATKEPRPNMSLKKGTELLSF